jgi:hypothetical protein
MLNNKKEAKKHQISINLFKKMLNNKKESKKTSNID